MGAQRFTIEISKKDEAARRWTDVTITGPFRGTAGKWQVLPAPGGPRVRLQVEMRAHGLWRLLMPLIDRPAGNNLEGTQQGEFAGIAPTGKYMKIYDFAMYQIDQGKFTDVWSLVDIQGLREQLLEAGAS